MMHYTAKPTNSTVKVPNSTVNRTKICITIIRYEKKLVINFTVNIGIIIIKGKETRVPIHLKIF